MRFFVFEAGVRSLLHCTVHPYVLRLRKHVDSGVMIVEFRHL